MMVESISEEKSCTNVFAHDSEELSAVFTKLWIQIINKKEAQKNHINVANVNILDL